jgi:hypothetical protein
MIRLIIRTLCIFFAISPLCFAQTPSKTKLYPSDVKPRKNTTSLVSSEQRVGAVLYQVFYHRGQRTHEAFRVDIGSYNKEQLVSDWNYGIIGEKDATGDGIPSYVWYGGDDTGQRLLWFLPKDGHYECINIFKSTESAWKKKFGRAAPDLGEVFGDYMVDDVTWDALARQLTVSVGANEVNQKKTRTVKLTLAPSELMSCKR